MSWFHTIDIDSNIDGDIVDGGPTDNCLTRSMALWSKIRTLVTGNRASIGAQGLLIGALRFEFEFIGSMLLLVST